jgi:hypothetical protein
MKIGKLIIHGENWRGSTSNKWHSCNIEWYRTMKMLVKFNWIMWPEKVRTFYFLMPKNIFASKYFFASVIKFSPMIF